MRNRLFSLRKRYHFLSERLHSPPLNKRKFMAFSATKRELGELYTFFRLLADGAVSLGTPKAEKDERCAGLLR